MSELEGQRYPVRRTPKKGLGGSAGRGGEMLGLYVEDVREQSIGTGVICVRRSVFDGRENTTKSDKARYAPIDAPVIAERRVARPRNVL